VAADIAGDGGVALAKRETALGTLITSSILLILAGVAFYLFFFPVLEDVLMADSWESVPCEILSSSVVTHEAESRGSSQTETTYSIKIRYWYEVDGRGFTGDRYSFMDSGSDSKPEDKRAIVSKYPTGATRDCYVDPENPSSAVLYRGYPRMLWFGLIPLLVALIGLRRITKAAGRMMRA
jgi:hypothetical protein